MKKIIVIILSLLLSYLRGPAQGDLLAVVVDKLSMRGEMAYYQGSPFTGIAYSMTGGQKTLEIIYKNGNKEGNHTEWYANGKKKSEYLYSNGRIINGEYKTWDEHGDIKKMEYYSDSRLSKIETFKAGKRNGMAKEFYNSGELKTEMSYRNDELDGKSTTYTQSGKRTKEVIYAGGKKTGAEIQYDDNDRIVSKVQYDMASSPISSVEFKYGTAGALVSELHYDSNHQLDDICFEKWDDGTIKWKRKYDHGQVLQIIEENKNDPMKSIKNFVTRNPNCILGTAYFLPPNDWKLDHYNIEIRYNLGNFQGSDRIQSNINNIIFKFRLRNTDRNSSEQINDLMTVRNCKWQFKWDTQQNFLEAAIGAPAGYRCIMTVDLVDETYMGAPASTYEVAYTSPKFPNQQEALDNAINEIGYKVTDKIYSEAPIGIGVKAIGETRKNGIAKTIVTNGGLQAGLYKKLRLRVFDVTPDVPGGNIIGKIEVMGDISDDVAKCEIVEGGEKITSLLQQGKILKAVAP